MKRFGITILCAAVITALSIAALVSYYAYTQSTLKLRQAESIQNFFGQYFWRYGVVESISLEERFLVVRVQVMLPQPQVRLVRVYFDEESQFIEQHLLSTDGIYTALSSRAIRDPKDISVGDSVALFTEAQADAGRIYVRTLLLGNSL
jgi:hypothetical protein